MKILIEATYQRIPREHWRPGAGTEPSVLHNGSIRLSTEGGEPGMFEFKFTEKKLDYMAAALHYLARGMVGLGYATMIKLTKKPPRGGRGVTHELNLSQFERIYRSEKSAIEFFAPIEFTRGEDVATGE